MSEYLASIGPAVANHLWQTTAFAAAAWAVTLALGRNQARVRYAVWLAASVKFLVPFALLIWAGNLLPHPKHAVAPVVYSAMDTVEEPFAVTAVEVVAPAVHAPTLRERMEAAMPAGLAVMWALGAGVVLMVWASRWRAVRRVLRRAEIAREGREGEILRRVELAINNTPGAKAPSWLSRLMSGLKSRPIKDCGVASRPVSEARTTTGILRSAQNDNSRTEAAIGIRPLRPAQGQDGNSENGAVELRLSAERMEPGIFGVWRPVLVWPRELSARLDDAQIDAVMAHELMHVRRRDNLTAALHMLVEAAFWFHPAVWWMERRMVKEREQACDEAVVAMGGDAETYAESLLKTVRFCIESPLTCVAGVTGGELKQRVMAIVTGRALLRMTWPKKLLLAAAAMGAVGAPVVFGVVRMIPMYGQILHATGPLPSFEVATIRPLDQMHFMAPPGGAGPRVAPNGEPIISQQEIRVSNAPPPAASNMVNETMTAKMLIVHAYNLPAFSKAQIVGGPDWADQTMYQIKAKIDDAEYAAMQGMAREQQVQQVDLMEQSLLAARFKLKVHFETREVPVYALQVAKGGPKLTPAKTDGVPAGSAAAAPPAQPADLTITGKGDGFELKGKRASPGQLMMLMQQQPELGNRMVIDKTGLDGKYDMTLDWTRAGAATVDAGVATTDAAPSLFTAVEEQLGLELVETKGPVEVIVIDQIEKPTVDGAEVMQPTLSPKGDKDGAPAQPLKVGTLTQLAAKLTLAPSGAMGAAAAQVPGAMVQEKATQGGTAAGADYLPTMTFDVASIHETKPNPNGMMVGGGFQPPNSSSLKMTNIPIVWLLQRGYEVARYQISGMPDWVNDNTMIYNVEAKADSAAEEKLATLSPEQVSLEQSHMIQVMLTERFNFRAHWETKPGPVLNLVAVKEAKLHPAGSMPPTAEELKNFGDRPIPPISQRRDGELGFEFVAHSCSMKQLASWLGNFQRMTVVDTTGLTGTYDFVLRYSQAGEGEREQNPGIYPSILDGIQGQLGLKLVNDTAPTKLLVVDHIERPSAN